MDPQEQNSHGNFVRITTELGNISLNPGQEKLFCQTHEVPVFRQREPWGSRGQEPRKFVDRNLLTIVQADVGGSSSEGFFSGEPTESVHAVVEVYIDDWFAELNRTSNESAAIVRRSITSRESSTEEPLRTTAS